MKILSFLVTLMAGMFFCFGFLVAKKNNHKPQIYCMTMAISFVVLLGLICFDLGQEVYFASNFTFLKKFIIMGLGLSLLGLTDLLIPHHHHDHHDHDDDKLEHQNHAFHINYMTISAFMIHNMIEGLALYFTCLNSFKAGILMMLAIGIHNLPIGLNLGLTKPTKKAENKQLLISLILLMISTVVGVLITLLFNIKMTPNVEITLLALTLGMLIYLVFGELLMELKTYWRNKNMYFGIIIGIILLIITKLL